MREIRMLRSTWRGLETWHGRDAVTLADERARQQGTRTSTYTGAPVFDPTCERLGVKFPGPTRHAIGRTGASPMGLAPRSGSCQSAIHAARHLRTPRNQRPARHLRPYGRPAGTQKTLASADPPSSRSIAKLVWQRSLDLRQSCLIIFQASFAGSMPRQQRSAAFGSRPFEA